MIKTIFINRKDTIDTYQININKRKIERIQKAMDNFSIKDEEQKVTTNSDFFVSNPDFFGKKIKILSKKYIGKDLIFYYCCSEIDNVDVYEYKYYSYTPYKLSQLCDDLIKKDNSLYLSYCIHDILNYQCKSDIERESLKKILNSIKFKKINDVSFLVKFKNELDSLILQKSTAQLDVDFDKVVEQEIQNMQVINEAFHSQELNGQPLIYSMNEKNNIKKKIIRSLPSFEKLK